MRGHSEARSQLWGGCTGPLTLESNLLYQVELSVLVPHSPETRTHANTPTKPEEDMDRSTIWDIWKLEAAEGDYY